MHLLIKLALAVTFVLNFSLLIKATANENTLLPTRSMSLHVSKVEYSSNTVLVKYKPHANVQDKTRAHQLVNASKAKAYGVVKALEKLTLSSNSSVEQAIEKLQHLPFIEYAEPDYKVSTTTNDSHYSLLWGLENIGQTIQGSVGTPNADIDADLAWGIYSNNGTVIVAVIDTGVNYLHPDLDNNIWVNANEIPNNNIDDDNNGYIDDVHGVDFFANDGDPMDEDGHGTHVSGTICAEAENAQGVVGVARNCQIMALRFIGPNGGYTSDAIEALNYAVMMGAKISNNSWGGGGYSQSLVTAIQNAANQGHLFIAAAGNDGVNTDSAPHYPSSYSVDNIISVAATDNKNQLAGFSNYGINSVDVGAPGVNIASTMLNSYYWSSGTSMAAPHVSGLAALLLSQHPTWSYREIRDQILSTGVSIPSLTNKTLTGKLVNAFNALNQQVLPPVAPTNLQAQTISHEEIQLSWLDNADNEASYTIERSINSGATWSTLVSLPANTTNHSDLGLAADTRYDYRVFASNSADNSPYSNETSATTDIMPTNITALASGEIFAFGTINGTYINTWQLDNSTQTLTERESGGKPANRYSHLQHTWTFSTAPGLMTFIVNAATSNSLDNDNFVFSYSFDGNEFTDMLTLSSGDSGQFSYAFSPSTSSQLWIRVEDTNRSPGNKSLDELVIDHMYVLIETNQGTPPVAPSNLQVSSIEGTNIDLIWTDNALDETGFSVERTLNGENNWLEIANLPTDSNSYQDSALSPNTQYQYRVRAYNFGGNSPYSNTVNVTSGSSSELQLTANGYKVKGWQYVDLSWTGLPGAVDIYRNGQIIFTTANSQFTDEQIAKGSNSYEYLVCYQATQNCSTIKFVIF